MKTKNLLFAMALPVAFAACSSEEFETLQNGQVDLGARKALGDVTLVFNGAEANTRLEIGQGGIGFSQEDGVGACLVDAPNANWGVQGKAAIQQYGLTNYISTNYLYKTVDGGATWTTEARMVEGNYVFYAPQNESHLVRSSIQAELPNPQVIKLKDGAPDQYSAIQQLIDAKTPMYIGYKFLDAATQTNDISVSMKPIYAYPKITLKNSFGVTAPGVTPAVTSATKDLKISRVVIKSAAIAQKTSLKIGTVNAQASKSATGVVGNLFNYGTDSNKYGKWEANAKLFGCVSADVLTTAAQGGTTSAVVLDFEEPYVLGKDQSISFNAVLPAKAYTDIKIGVYTDQGYFESAEITATLIPGQMYPQQEYMENGSLNQNVKGQTLTEEMVDRRGATGEIVATTAELEALVKSGQGDLLVTPLNSDVEYNAAIAGYMLQGGVQSITFTDAVTVNGANVTKKLVFNGDVIIKGSVVFGESNITWNANTVKVNEGATLTVSDFATATATGDIVPAAGSTLILNSATKVPAIKSDAEGKVKVNASLAMPAAFTSYEGEIEVVAGKTMTLSADFNNKGTLTNNGTIALAAHTLTNEGTVENKNLIKGGNITNNGTFDNEKIVDATFANAGSYTNADQYTVATLNVKTGAIMNKTV